MRGSLGDLRDYELMAGHERPSKKVRPGPWSLQCQFEANLTSWTFSSLKLERDGSGRRKFCPMPIPAMQPGRPGLGEAARPIWPKELSVLQENRCHNLLPAYHEHKRC